MSIGKIIDNKLNDLSMKLMKKSPINQKALLT